MSFLRCHKFVNDSSQLEVVAALESLTAEVRGVSDPIVASYLRMYLVRTAHQVLSSSTSPQMASNIGRSNYKVRNPSVKYLYTLYFP